MSKVARSRFFGDQENVANWQYDLLNNIRWGPGVNVWVMHFMKGCSNLTFICIARLVSVSYVGESRSTAEPAWCGSWWICHTCPALQRKLAMLSLLLVGRSLLVNWSVEPVIRFGRFQMLSTCPNVWARLTPNFQGLWRFGSVANTLSVFRGCCCRSPCSCQVVHV